MALLCSFDPPAHAAGASSPSSSGNPPNIGLTADGRLRACEPKTSCVSTSSFMSPSQYMPPWLYTPRTQDEAVRDLEGYVRSMGGSVLKEDLDAGYVAAEIPYKMLKGTDIDDVEFLLKPDGTVLFRSKSRVTSPDPPGCLLRGCISGPKNRGRMDGLRNAVSFTPLETDEDKEWVQLLLH